MRQETVPSATFSIWQWIAPFAIVGAVFLVFRPDLSTGFVGWDDDDLLKNNVARLQLTSDNLRWMFTTSFFGHYQPLTWLSYAIDYWFWNADPKGYHYTNVALHACAAVSFYFVALRLLRLGTHSVATPQSASGMAAATFAALVFACHPLRAESVSWLAERRDVLSGALYIAAIGLYLRYTEALASPDDRSAVGGKNVALAFYLGSFLICGLSLLAKAIAMTVPFVLLILDLFPLRRLGGTAGWWRGKARGIWAEKLPFLALGAAFAVRALVAQQVGGMVKSTAQHDLPSRIAQAFYGLGFYVWKTIWPAFLGPLYQIPPRSQLLGPGTLVIVVIVISTAIWAIRMRRKLPGLVATLATYAVIVAPVLGIAQSGPQLVADRYSYIPCLGFAVLGGWLMGRLLVSGKGRPWFTNATLFVGVIIVVFLGMATTAQAALWRDPMRLWEHGIRVSPNSSIAYCNYADCLARAGRLEEALPAYQRALELDPQDVVALHHIGDLYLTWKNYEKAIEFYRRTIAVNPKRHGVHYVLARLLVAKGQWPDAMAVLRDGARHHPQHSDMLEYLADMLATAPDAQFRNGKEAVFWASKASALRGNQHALTLLTLASAFAEAGQFDQAVAAARRAIPLAEQSGDSELAGELRRRLNLFEQGRPYHYGE